MDRGIGGNFGYRYTDFFPSSMKKTGSGIVRRKRTYNGRTSGSLRKPGYKSRKYKSDQFKRLNPKKKSYKRKRTSTKKKGSFKKAKKIRTAPSRFAKRHYDDYGSLERDHCAYIGFQRHGCKDRMWSVIGEALTKALLAKIKVYPRSYDEILDIPRQTNNLELVFKRVSVPGGTEDVVSENIGVAGDTFEELSAQVATSLKTNAERTSDTDLVYAYYPYEARWKNTAGSIHEDTIIKDLGESVIELYATQNITVKNLTPNDGGTSELDVVGVNPIHGKKYEFNNFRPKLIDTIRDENPFLSSFSDVDDVTGVNTEVALVGADNIIAHPPVPRQLFTNCSRSTPVYMGAGGVKSERTSFRMKHKISTFIERIYYNQYDKGSFGGCTFFAFERKTRSVTGTSRVKISFDRALHMSAHCKLAVKKTMLKHYENTALGEIADA